MVVYTENSKTIASFTVFKVHFYIVLSENHGFQFKPVLFSLAKSK